MCMKTSEEARLCINIHLRCSVSFQPSRISTYFLQQIHHLLFNNTKAFSHWKINGFHCHLSPLHEDLPSHVDL